MAMDQELSISQIQELESDLHQLKLDLEGLLDTTESGAKPVTLRDNTGRLSRMDEMHNQSILVANRNLTRNRLKQVLIALTRADKDTYGRCTTCDEPISYPRLKAYPEADMCLDCKGEIERG
ncbi:MAG: hypothetical protein CMQ19_02065 [Gammaproteobacteria bacterium]|jgi:DnaK suppressor protein|nr:hypothetical protein [Gammaproteobacteria bacterium]|tara:strand:- start:384 stop:749 length:366 start_codon:yes stop_codon:yes gene_type:complete